MSNPREDYIDALTRAIVTSGNAKDHTICRALSEDLCRNIQQNICELDIMFLMVVPYTDIINDALDADLDYWSSILTQGHDYVLSGLEDGATLEFALCMLRPDLLSPAIIDVLTRRMARKSELALSKKLQSVVSLDIPMRLTTQCNNGCSISNHPME